MNFKLLIIFLFIYALSTKVSFANDFKIEQLGKKEYIFPYLIAKQKTHQNIAENINTYLHLEFLDLLPNSYKNNPFKVINPEKHMPRLMVYDYDIKQNNKLISVNLSMEGCGAYCEAFQAQKNFLTNSGQIVPAQALFTKKGLEDFSKINHKNIQKEIKSFLQKESIDEEQVELYEECLSQTFKGKIHVDTEYTINKSNLVISSGRCSNHAMRALDDLGDFSNAYSFTSIQKHLSPLGKYLLDSRQKEIPHNPIIEGVYKGKIANKYPIKLFINKINNDGSIRASYWYTKYKKPIELSGNYKDGKLKLYVEKHNQAMKKWIKVESIIGTINNNLFKGEWTNLNTHKPYLLNMYLN